MPKNKNNISANEIRNEAEKLKKFEFDREEAEKKQAVNSITKILAKQYKDAIPETEASVYEAKKSKTSLSDREINRGAKGSKDFEYNTSDQAVKNRTNQLIIEIANDIEKEQKRKRLMRDVLMIFFALYFLAVSGFVAYIILNSDYTEDFKKVLIGGFFVNLIGLFAIIFKYIFSPSKELLEFFEVISNKKDKAEN